MDRSSEQFPWLSLWLGVALVFVWGLMSLAQAYDRSLATVDDSFSHGFMFLARLETILESLNRLSVEQRAFLSTGDERFQDGVIENAEILEINADILNSMVAVGRSERPLLTGLSRSITQVLDLVGQSDAIRDARNGAAAAAFFDSKDDAVALAQWQAGQLRIQVTRGLAGRIRNARGCGALLEAFFYAEPVGTAFGRGVAFWNSARLAGRAANTGQLWARP